MTEPVHPFGKEYRCRVCDGPVEWPHLVCHKCWLRDQKEQEWESYLEFIGSNDPARGHRKASAKDGHGRPGLFEQSVLMLGPEKQKNGIIVDRLTEDKCPKLDTAYNLHNTVICPMCKEEKELVSITSLRWLPLDEKAATETLKAEMENEKASILVEQLLKDDQIRNMLLRKMEELPQQLEVTIFTNNLATNYLP